MASVTRPFSQLVPGDQAILNYIYVQISYLNILCKKVKQLDIVVHVHLMIAGCTVSCVTWPDELDNVVSCGNNQH